VVHGGRSHRDVDFSRASVVVIGNEADGLDVSTIERCGESISIPMDGRSESLNAGIAASLIAFEALWQRRDAAAVSPPRSL
jgi:tRNA G18 (ribose-2'-O)-methylase SpoU